MNHVPVVFHFTDATVVLDVGREGHVRTDGPILQDEKVLLEVLVPAPARNVAGLDVGSVEGRRQREETRTQATETELGLLPDRVHRSPEQSGPGGGHELERQHPG